MITANTNYVGINDVDYGPETEKSNSAVWAGYCEKYLQSFWQSFHPYRSKLKVRVIEGFMFEFHHYAAGAFYCTVTVIETDKPIYAQILFFPWIAQIVKHNHPEII